ncbi:DUF6600 domain-containing protein [Ramlibacter sp. 2FC]|uniref:DUF6600 domain-containing protein n=1 Tax=Ramlibacter sp. 2FC TaxID=2502188 RepID=UPI0010F4B20C|nr:DUF6600 domain-containing protein [Ramlibacter sp. 2FC]
MQTQAFRSRVFTLVVFLALSAFGGWAHADPPSRVARLGYLSGTISFSPAGEDDWVQASLNRPLTTGDRLWADAGARAEIQVGGAMIRMNAGAGVSVLNLDDRIAQLQLTQGTLNVRVRRLEPGQVFELDTPNLALTLRQPGEFRIEVDPDADTTTIVLRSGHAEVYGEDASYVLDPQQGYRFTGTRLRDFRYVDALRFDEFDRWSGDRDRRYDNSASARYVSPDLVGYQDLDENGSWRVDAIYGNVWIPHRVAVGWSPYRDGHWAWIDPWGWTWVDDAPWGFAVSHYGRWAHVRGTWAWVPGPVRTRAYYAPALVVFVGGANFRISISIGNVGGVAWFPLGPREVYRPAYPVSRGYFENINRSNTIVNTTIINNTYNNLNVTQVVYVNQQVPGAVIAVPTTAFVQAQPVSRTAVVVSRDMMAGGSVAVVPPVAPTEKSVRGAATQGDKPPARVFERPVVARTAPPPAPVGFAAQQPRLAARPGQPLDEAERKALKPAAPAPVVKVVTPTQEAVPALRPPAAEPGGRPGDSRERSDERRPPTRPSVSGAPTPGVAPPPAAPPAPAVQPPEPRARPEGPHGQREQREPPATEPRVVVPPQVTPPESADPRRSQRARPEPAPADRQAEPRPPLAVPTPAPQPAPKEQPRAQDTPPAPAAQAPEPRARPEGPRGQREQREPAATEPRTAAPPPQVAPTTESIDPRRPKRTRPEAAPAADSQAEPRPPLATPTPPSSKPEPAPRAQPRVQEPRSAASRAADRKREIEEREREERIRLQRP